MANIGSSAKFGVVVCKSSLLLYLGGSIGQSRIVCQVWCTDIQGISALVPGQVGDTSVKVGLSTKFGVLVFKAFLLWYCGGGPLAKVGSSVKFCVVVFKEFLLWYLGDGGLLATVGSSANLGQWYARPLFSIMGVRLGPLAKVGSSAKFCLVVFKGSLLWYKGGLLAKVGSSAKFCAIVCKSSLLAGTGGVSAKVGFICQVFCVNVCKSTLLW